MTNIFRANYLFFCKVNKSHVPVMSPTTLSFKTGTQLCEHYCLAAEIGRIATLPITVLPYFPGRPLHKELYNYLYIQTYGQRTLFVWHYTRGASSVRQTNFKIANLFCLLTFLTKHISLACTNA